uniref:RING-type domain-containing protein n=1 Tax=Dendroctonus ponderosae TaxID=77166 RepID=A0AAR5QEK5_DENPD
MSVLVEPCSGPIWRKRPFKGLDGPDVKRSRVAQLQLEPERPRSSDEDTESVSSIQEKETDYVNDASEPESQTSVQSSTDEYEVEVAYEVESNGNSSDISSPESDMMVAVAAAMICNKPLDAWLTDAEASYSDSSTSLDEIAFRRQEFTTCLLCKTKNPNPLYRYCEQCFQERKTLLPARPVQKRCWVKANKYKSNEIAALKAYQSGHSQDSGMGLSEEMSPYGLEPTITVYRSGTSASLTRLSANLSQKSKLRSAKRKLLKKTGLKRARPFSESSRSISEFEVKKPKLLPKPDKTPLEGSELVSCTFPSIETILTSDKLQLELPIDSQKESIVSSEPKKTTETLSLTEHSQTDLTDEAELCIFCNSAPKDSIFVHGKTAHHCSCYPCAKRTLTCIGRCPLCNAGLETVMRMC